MKNASFIRVIILHISASHFSIILNGREQMNLDRLDVHVLLQ